MRKETKNWYRVSSLHTTEGLFELYEHKTLGDEMPGMVKLNGEIIAHTWDSLSEFYINDWLTA